MRKAIKSYNDAFLAEARKCSTPQQILAISDKELRTTQVEQGIRRVYMTTCPYFADQAVKQLKPRKAAPDNITPDPWLETIDRFVKTRLGKRITWITETTKDFIFGTTQRIVNDAIQEGLGVDKITEQIAKEFSISEKYRAERIARTEVVSASNQGSFMGAESLDVDLDKEWISYVDDRTRDSHLPMPIGVGGEVVGMNEPFSNGLDYPGDPDGEADEVINCRCTIGYAEKTNDISIGREIPE
jgi:uncharacterized protein with gpF-like domain